MNLVKCAAISAAVSFIMGIIFGTYISYTNIHNKVIVEIIKEEVRQECLINDIRQLPFLPRGVPMGDVIIK